MKNSIVVRQVLPFIQWYGLMIFFTLLADFLLHRLQWVSVGRYLGYAGTALVLLSFLYSLRKRKFIASGSPKQYLALHEYLSWAGSVMILVHAGIHFNAILPWLAVLLLLIVVASGLTGKYLLKKANETLKEKKKSLLATGSSPEEADKKLFFDSVTVDIMKKWRTVHMPITLLLGLLSLLHILSILMYAK
ncbi:MAG: hypothetical protein HYZ15_09665 [Sphingobacteriales bacterium]|nr:hypothetical protein [Sphingobacteriales bacterium]